MRCPNCGATLLEGRQFCTQCGTKVSEYPLADDVGEVPDDAGSAAQADGPGAASAGTDPWSTPVSVPQDPEAWDRSTNGEMPESPASEPVFGGAAHVSAGARGTGSDSGDAPGGCPTAVRQEAVPDSQPAFAPQPDPLSDAATASALRARASAARAERQGLADGSLPSVAQAAQRERTRVALWVILAVAIAITAYLIIAG